MNLRRMKSAVKMKSADHSSHNKSAMTVPVLLSRVAVITTLRRSNFEGYIYGEVDCFVLSASSLV